MITKIVVKNFYMNTVYIYKYIYIVYWLYICILFVCVRACACVCNGCPFNTACGFHHHSGLLAV
jgi:hypothetical protein